MPLKVLVLLLLVSITAAKAENLVPKDSRLPLDLMELLGELEDTDDTALGVALSEIEQKKSATDLITIVKKSPTGGEKQ